jgi:hypothetical protein
MTGNCGYGWSVIEEEIARFQTSVDMDVVFLSVCCTPIALQPVIELRLAGEVCA